MSQTGSQADSVRLLPSERQVRIRQLVQERDVLRISDLAQALGVSEMTIRRDLDTLEKSGLIERRFGVAVATEQSAAEVSYKVRLELHGAQKDLIAAHAATLVQEGDTVAIDASTTGLALARRLGHLELTVVTNSLDVAQELRLSRATVLVTGGVLRQPAGSFVGSLAISSLRSLRVDHAFFSAKGMLIPDGFLDSDLSEIEVKQRMLESAARVTALVDSSKFAKRALGCIARFDEVDALLTDAGLDPWAQERLREYVPLTVLGGNP